MMLADQAAGLRRVLAPPALQTRFVTGVSSATSHSAVTADLALALANQGREVLLLDAANAERGAAWLLGVEEQPDLMDAVCGTRDIREIAATPRLGLRVLCASRFLQGWQRLTERDLGNLAQSLAVVCQDFDVMLVDAPIATIGSLPLADNPVIVARTDPDSITRAYRLLKREGPALARKQVSVLLLEADAVCDAPAVFGNLATTTSQFLGLPLSSLGSVPDDPLARRAWGMRQPVLDLFPRSDAAHALRRCADTMMLSPQIAPASMHVFVARIISAVRALDRTR